MKFADMWIKEPAIAGVVDTANMGVFDPTALKVIRGSNESTVSLSAI
ncbi:2489_t:CDS:2, partial [Gigaspora rosea]